MSSFAFTKNNICKKGIRVVANALSALFQDSTSYVWPRPTPLRRKPVEEDEQAVAHQHSRELSGTEHEIVGAGASGLAPKGRDGRDDVAEHRTEDEDREVQPREHLVGEVEHHQSEDQCHGSFRLRPRDQRDRHGQ